MSTEAREDKSVDLAFFDGKQFTLTAVDQSLRFPTLYSGDANGLAFTLDGVTYAAVEDENDGYRSSLDRVLVLPADTPMSTTIPPHVVVGRVVDKGEYRSAAEIVELLDVQTGKCVLAFGTDNSDDYYPSYVAEWSPEGLAANREA